MDNDFSFQELKPLLLPSMIMPIKPSYKDKYVTFLDRCNRRREIARQNYSTLLMGKKPTRETLGSGIDLETESTMYIDYPPTKPFVNDDYERPPYKSVSQYPEGNRKAVVNALKNLQEKIHQLEAERTAAEDNLKSLATETSKYSDILKQDNERRPPKQTMVSKQNQELESQLSAAETRCNLLEKQLEHMKGMVETSDKERTAAIKKAVLIDVESKPTEPMSSDFQNNLRKIADLEREHIKLTANQSLAESKIRELEEKLGEERIHHRLMVEKSAAIESVRKANEILNHVDEDDSLDQKPVKLKRPVKKKKKAVVSKKTGHMSQRKGDDSKHYRLNLADIPFVAGKNTGPSHSVGANVQKVLSLMKSHNMALCSRATYPMSTCHTPSQSSSGSTSPTTESDLAEILLQLQDEFHRMSFEHQEYSKEISDTADPRIREDLERELDSLVARMEAKSQQISKIRRHQDKIASKKKKKAKSSKQPDNDDLPRRPRSAQSCSPRVTRSRDYDGEVEVTTTIKPKGTANGIVIRPSSARQISLNVLKDMKKLQTTLRKDDLSWDC